MTGGHEAWPEPSVDFCYKTPCVSSIVQTKRDRRQHEAWPNHDRTVTGKHVADIKKYWTNNKKKLVFRSRFGHVRSRFVCDPVTLRLRFWWKSRVLYYKSTLWSGHASLPPVTVRSRFVLDHCFGFVVDSFVLLIVFFHCGYVFKLWFACCW